MLLLTRMLNSPFLNFSRIWVWVSWSIPLLPILSAWPTNLWER